MKKIVLFMIVMTFIVIGAQQFITKKSVPSSQKIQSKDLLYDLIDLEKRVPNLLHITADLLQSLHMHIEACIDGEKNACTKIKNLNRRELYKEAIIKINNTIDRLEVDSKHLINLLKIDSAVAVTGDSKKV